MSRKLQIEIVGDSASAERMFKKLGSSAGTFSAKATHYGRIAAAGLLAVGAGVAYAAKKAVTAASDLNEQVNKAGVVFRKNGDAVVKWAGSLVGSFGISQRAGLEAAGTFGNMLVPMGFARDKAAQMSEKMVQLAGDMASFNNASPEETLQALGAGLAGQVRPLRRFGVFLDIAREKQVAMNMGLYKGKGNLTAAAKAAAAYAIILKDSKDAQGDFARTVNDSLPNAQRVIHAAFENIQAQIGGMFLPLIAKATLKFADFLRKLSDAKGVRAKLSVIWEAAEGTAKSVESALMSAIARVNWSAVWSRAQGIGEGLKQRFESIDWSGVGHAIGDGIAAGVGAAASVGKKLADAIGEATHSIDWTQLGRAAGPGIATAMAVAVKTALDPAFWLKNWDVALAIGLSVFGGSVLKIAGRLAAPIVRVFGDAMLGVLGVIERFSPRLAATLLAIITRLPGLVGRALAPLLGVVSSLFGKLGGVAKFAVKVLGIDAALQAVVAFAQMVKQWLDRVIEWFKGLPGRIRGAIPNPAGILAGIGVSIISGLWNGMKSVWGKTEGWLGGLAGHIPHIKGPESKDAQLLVANGRAIMGGLLAGMKSGWQENEAFLSGLAGRLQAKINRLQNELDAAQRAATDRANQQALADAQKALSDAQKKGKGVAAAERAVQDALQQIRDSANQRELDRLTKQHDRIVAKLERLKQRAADKLQQLRDKAGAAFDELAAKIQRAFSAKNDAWVSPAQQALDAMNDRRQQEDLAQAVSDAQQRLNEAMAGGNQDEITAANRELQRALEDQQAYSLEKQAAEQQRAHDQAVDAQQEALDKLLAALRTKFTEQGVVYDDGIKGILKIIGAYDGDFESIGGLLGAAFVKGLREAMNAAAGAGSQVSGSTGGGGGGGGSSGGGTRSIANRAGGTTVNVYNEGSVITENELADTVRRAIIRTGSRNAE